MRVWDEAKSEELSSFAHGNTVSSVGFVVGEKGEEPASIEAWSVGLLWRAGAGDHRKRGRSADR